MKVSVALCTRDGEQYISRQLSSIAAQSRLPDELVVNDDRSTDGTVKIIEAFAAVAPFPVDLVVNEDRLGVSHNFEAAIARCSGDVIVLSDQDDVWLPHRLEAAEDRLQASPDVCLTFSDAHLIGEQGRRTGRRLWDLVGFGPKQQARLRRDPFGQLMARSIVSGCTLALRASHRDLVLPFPAERTASQMRVLHDRWISLVLAAAYPIDVNGDALVEYRLHPRQQVGIPALQMRRMVPSSALRWRSAAVPTSEHLARLRATIGLLEEIRRRVEAGVPGPRGRAAVGRVDGAMAHLRARAALDAGRSRRAPGVAKELLSGRYHSYSLGTASAMADLVRPRGRRRH